MTRLTGGPELLEAAVRYALDGAALATGPLRSHPTPCPGWDLATLLDHLSDSIGVFTEAIATASVPALANPGPGDEPAARLRGQAARLLTACAAAGPGRQLVAIGDRELTPSVAAMAGAIEIAVHGWDIFAAGAASRPIPPRLATALLPAAALLVTPRTRPGLFASPVRLPGPACPGDQLVAFLGRQPRFPAATPEGRLRGR